MANKPKGDVPQSFTDSMNNLKTQAGNAVNTIKDLKNQVKTNMTPAEVQAAQGTIDEVANALQAVADVQVPPAPQE